MNRFVLLLLTLATAAQARTIDLAIDRAPKAKITINGTSPGPVLRLKEGEAVDIRVTNRMAEKTSIHWHGLLLPGPQDGAPGFNAFHGIAPGDSFTYRFKLRQSQGAWRMVEDADRCDRHRRCA